MRANVSWRPVIGATLSPWWMAGKPGDGHFARGLAALVIFGAIAGWLLVTGDRQANALERYGIWAATIAPIWGGSATIGVLWRYYRVPHV